MPSCDLCSHDPVTYIRYNGTHLCADHFKKYVQKRVKKEIRRQTDMRSGGTIAVAVSGGKDSMVTLSLIHDVFGDRPDVDIQCITIDEGIKGYRPESIDMVKDLCKELGVKYNEVSFKDSFGITMDEVAPLSGDSSPCTYCGVFRRKLMNDAARKMGAKYLATGLNLDDTAQSIMMNFVRGDVERLARLGPHKKVQPGLIPRIQPLRLIPEKESLLYAIVSGLPYHDGECPYASEALRNQFRATVDDLENRSPGTRFSIVSSYDTLLPMLMNNLPPADLKKCECGEPTLGKQCKACELSSAVKERIRDL
jgi:TIGR00269 family protein